MLSRLIVVSVIVLGLILAGVAVWVQRNAEHRCLEYWGTRDALLIRDASEVHVRVLGESAGHVNLQQARGLAHVRYALLQDESFRWPAKPAEADSPWTHALEFEEGDAKVVILIDLEHATLKKQSAKEALDFAPLAEFLRHFIADAVPKKSSVSAD